MQEDLEITKLYKVNLSRILYLEKLKLHKTTNVINIISLEIN